MLDERKDSNIEENDESIQITIKLNKSRSKKVILNRSKQKPLKVKGALRMWDDWVINCLIWWGICLPNIWNLKYEIIFCEENYDFFS